jgi:hypothetical protein
MGQLQLQDQGRALGGVKGRDDLRRIVGTGLDGGAGQPPAVQGLLQPLALLAWSRRGVGQDGGDRAAQGGIAGGGAADGHPRARRQVGLDLGAQPAALGPLR